MSSSLEFLTHLTNMGASVSLDGDELVLNAPKAVITPELHTELRSRKAELLVLLRSVKTQQPISRNPVGYGPSALSHAQQRIWFLNQLQPTSSIWNVATVLQLRGTLDVTALARSLGEIVSRHGVLRSVFSSIDGVPQFCTHAPAAEVLQTLRYSDAEVARAEAHKAAVQPFDLAVETFRAVLCTTPLGESFLTIAAHHIVCDGWSLGILSGELSSLYQAFSRGMPSPLPAVSFQYADYIAWEGHTSAASNHDLDWWKQRLAAPLPALQLPGDHPRSVRLGTAGRRITTHLPQAMVDQLHEFARRHEVTPFILLLAAFKILLFRYTGVEDVLVGTVSSHRKRREFEPVVGMFANPVVLRTSLSGNPPFRDLLARVRSTVTSSFFHDTVPFDRLVECLHPDRHANEFPIFQVSLTYQNLPLSKLGWDGIEIIPQRVEIPGARYDVSVELWETALGLSCDFEYRTDLLDAGTIERMQRNYLELLKSILADCDTPIEQLRILTAYEEQQVVSSWNGLTEDYPDRPIHSLFEERCAESPDAIALIEGAQAITYKQLNSASDCIANNLRCLGLEVGAPVAILMNRSAYSVMAMLGILKAGAFYVPLDASYPQHRLIHLLREAGAKYILLHSASTPEWLAQVTEWICLDVVSMAKPSSTAIPDSTLTGVSIDALMCVLYTSGSKGVPKGVEIGHRGLVRLLFSKQLASFGKREAVLHMAPQAFDASLLEIWGPLLHGGTCVIDSGLQPDLREIARLIAVHRVTAAWLTASLFNWIVMEAPQTFSPLREIYIGGEVLSTRHVLLAQQALPHLEIFNGYGPTEATVFTCIYPIPRRTDWDLDSLPIGRPLSNTLVYVLDAHQQPVPIGVPGELYIGGDALARGYRNQPELTRQHFISDPVTARGMLYRSGDLVNWLPDGNLKFIGRRDDQVKVRGHRIELSEIETAIARYPGVISNAVLVEKTAELGDRLVAWFSADGTVNPSDLRVALAGWLPPYLIPNVLLPLRSMPLQQNGKIDRTALAALPVPGLSHDAASLDASTDAAAAALPQGDLVCLIAEAMAELLGVSSVGPTDDFFLLGGHSLLALQLVSRIERLFGQQISAALLFQASTPATIALLLEDGATCRPQSLLPLRPSGTLPALFCVHLLAEDSIQQYLSLVRSLDRRVPVYALSPIDFAGQEVSLQAMAAAHISQMREVKTTGGYYLCGYSSGGILAFEIALQLRRAGEQVTLILIDSFPPRVLRRTLSREPWKLLQLATQPAAWKWMRDRSPDFGSDLKGKAAGLLRRLAFKSRPSPKLSQEKVADPLSSAMRRYVPDTYPGKVILFQSQAGEETKMFNLDGCNNWRRFTPGGVEIRSIPGNHLQIMTSPFVGAIARELLSILSSPAA